MGISGSCSFDGVRLDLSAVSPMEFGFRVFGEEIGEGDCEGRERVRGGRENVGISTQKARILPVAGEDGRSQGLKR